MEGDGAGAESSSSGDHEGDSGIFGRVNDSELAHLFGYRAQSRLDRQLLMGVLPRKFLKNQQTLSEFQAAPATQLDDLIDLAQLSS